MHCLGEHEHTYVNTYHNFMQIYALHTLSAVDMPLS